MKTLNELITILVDEQIITEEFKKVIINAAEAEKIDYAIKAMERLKTKIIDNETN